MKQDELKAGTKVFRYTDIKMKAYKIIGVTNTLNESLNIRPTVFMLTPKGDRLTMRKQTALDNYGVIKGLN